MTEEEQKPFPTIIYRQQDVDGSDPDLGVWVRISPDHWGVSVATFWEKPDEQTPEWKALASFDFDPCYDNQSKLVVWDEHRDPERDGGKEMLLVKDITRYVVAWEAGLPPEKKGEQA